MNEQMILSDVKVLVDNKVCDVKVLVDNKVFGKD